MKKIVLLVTTLLVIFSINYLIAKKEDTLAEGRTMLLRLAPVDPRSLIQGDYMALRYTLAREVPVYQLEDRGRIVVLLDENNVTKFVRVYRGGNLANGEYLLLYRNRGGLRLGAESFMFEEGNAELYSRALYSELKVSQSGESVLVGLRGKDFKPLGRKEKPNKK